MNRLDEFVARRHELADRYDELLSDLPVVTPWRASECRSSFHLYVIKLMTDEITKPHRQVFEDFHAGGVRVNLHYIPVYLQPFYAALGFRPGLCPEAERYYSEAISLPMYPDLTRAQQDAVIRVLSESIGI